MVQQGINLRSEAQKKKNFQHNRKVQKLSLSLFWNSRIFFLNRESLLAEGFERHCNAKGRRASERS